MNAERKQQFSVVCLTRLIESLLPQGLSEPMIGDLYEEMALRAETKRARRRAVWFASQACRSLPRMFLLSLKRWYWLKSLAIAALTFWLLGQLEPLVYRWLGNNFEPNVTQQIVISLAIGFASCASGGFVSTLMHRGSALLYSAIGTTFMVYGITVGGSSAPTWYLTAFVLIALIAPIVGGAGFASLAHRLQRRRRSDETTE